MGCQIVLSGLHLEPGDEIVTTDEEHFGLLGPLHVSGARVRVAATRGRTGDEALEAVLAEVGPRTRLIALSHVSWMTGHILPVDESRQTRTCRCSLTVRSRSAPSRSSWATPTSTPCRGRSGYAARTPPARCTSATWMPWRSPADVLVTRGARADGTFAPVDSAQRFDTGPIPVPSLAGLEVALRSAPQSRYDDARALTERCRELLSERIDVVTHPGQATLVTFVPDGDSAETVARLFEAGVVVRDIPETGWVRVSCGYWNIEEHLQRLLDALP